MRLQNTSRHIPSSSQERGRVLGFGTQGKANRDIQHTNHTLIMTIINQIGGGCAHSSAFIGELMKLLPNPGPDLDPILPEPEVRFWKLLLQGTVDLGQGFVGLERDG